MFVFDCGIKYNIIRVLLKVHKVELVVMPYIYALAEKQTSDDDREGKGGLGLFLSNGPGDTSMCSDTVKSIHGTLFYGTYF